MRSALGTSYSAASFLGRRWIALVNWRSAVACPSPARLTAVDAANRTVGMENGMLRTVEETFHQIWADIHWVSAQWKAYKVLFLDPAHTELLTAAAGSFFQAVKVALQRDVMMT